MPERMKIFQGDITTLEVDAIRKCRQQFPSGGGGVDGAIHRAAGPGLLAACVTLGGCNTGETKITGGYDLPSKHVIHTVGPVWDGGRANEDALLADCYRNSLKLGEENGLRMVAFPAISTDVFGFPKERAARIAVREVRAFLDQDVGVEQVIFACFSERDFDIYQRALHMASN